MFFDAKDKNSRRWHTIRVVYALQYVDEDTYPLANGDNISGCGGQLLSSGFRGWL